MTTMERLDRLLDRRKWLCDQWENALADAAETERLGEPPDLRDAVLFRVADNECRELSAELLNGLKSQ